MTVRRVYRTVGIRNLTPERRGLSELLGSVLTSLVEVELSLGVLRDLLIPLDVGRDYR